MIRKGQACIKFTETPPGTHYKPDSYSWVPAVKGREYVEGGYGVMYNPYERTDLPEDIPGRKAMLKNGIDNIERVKDLSKERLVELDGIGDKTADEIIAWIEWRVTK